MLRRLRAGRLGFALLLLGWFVYFSRDVVGAPFSPDDMMNIDNFYWSPGPWRLFYSQFLLWRGYYRPLGGLFYLPVLSIWGLNPAPYHVCLSLLLAGTVYLVYRLARLLGGSELAAGLAALVACYHAGLSNLYYNTAFIYDVLCWGFYAATLAYYIAIRQREQRLGWRQKLVFSALFVCCLNSKEMALTLPGVVLAYEWIYHVPGGREQGWWVKWLRGPASTALLAGCLTLVDLYGKIFGHDALTGMEGYRPVFTWQRFLDYQKTFLHDAAFLQVGGTGLLLFWATLTYLAWRPAAPRILRFCWAFLLLTPLPIEFLPGKSQACLAIPTMGLAIFVAVLVAGLAGWWGDILSREPIFRHLGRPAVTALLVAASIFYWGRENLRRQQHDVKPVMAALGAQTAHVLQEFRALRPQVRPGSHVVFLNDPFEAWDMLFIADLWFRDRSVTVHLQRLTPVPEQVLAGFESVFDYRDGKLERIR